MSRIKVTAGQRREERVPAVESRLLLQINKGFTKAWWDHFHELVTKRQEGTLSTEEHQELILLTDQLERREAKRLQALVKLAGLRKMSLSDLMTSLDLPGKCDA